jgi:hypothetical protein
MRLGEHEEGLKAGYGRHSRLEAEAELGIMGVAQANGPSTTDPVQLSQQMHEVEACYRFLPPLSASKLLCSLSCRPVTNALR